MKDREEKKFPRVGVGVFIVREGRVLLGQRQGAHGAGSWSLPGGHLEFMESWESCASREVAEETGLRVISSRPLTFTNDIFAKENKHYITIFILATVADGEAQILEPDKSNEWRWCDWDNLPRPLFLPLENLLSQGFNLEEYL